MVSGVLAVVAYKAGLVDTQEFAMTTCIGTIGSLLPDVDADNSKPVKIGFHVLSLGVVFAIISHWREQLSLLAMLMTWAVGYVAVRYGLFMLFARLTVHRGIIHSVPAMTLMGLLMVCVSFYGFDMTAQTSWFYGVFLWLGSLVHLALDELYSVNLFGLKIKRSFGTAFKFFHRKFVWRYVGLYVMIAILWYVAPPFSVFWQHISDPITWLLLKQAML